MEQQLEFHANYRSNRRIIKVKTHQLQAPTGKDVHCLFYKKSTTPTTQPMKDHHNPELLFFSNGPSFKITPHNVLLLPPKITFFPVCCTCYGFAVACMS